MAKIHRKRKFINRTIKFLLITGIIVYIDITIGMTSIINNIITEMVSKIFGLKIDNINIYMSLYAAIAVLLSSNIDKNKKLIYSLGLTTGYIIIFIFLTAFGVIFPNLSLILTLMVFITTTFPILLWIMIDNERIENNEKMTRYGAQSKPDRKNKNI